MYLTSGISTVAQMLGMFAMCQIIRDNAKGEAKMPDVDVKNMKGLGIGFKDIIENIKTIMYGGIFMWADLTEIDGRCVILMALKLIASLP